MFSILKSQLKFVPSLAKNTKFNFCRTFCRTPRQFQKGSGTFINQSSFISQPGFSLNQKSRNLFDGRTKNSHFLAAGLAAGLVIFGVSFISQSNAIELEVISSEPDDSVEVDPSVNSFPCKMVSPHNGKTEFSLIGYGVRKVTFIRFKVYALGIYIANEDIPKVAKVFDSPYLSSAFVDVYDRNLSHQGNLNIALNDPKTSDILINNLLEADVRFLIRIAPLKDTDFNHLRDGFIKSAVRNAYIKSEYPEKLSEGIELLRAVFKNKKSKCPKNHLFFVETDEEGNPTFTYQDLGKNPKLGKVKETITLGTVQNSVVSKAFLLNYFAAKNPIAKDARDKAIDEFIRLV